MLAHRHHPIQCRSRPVDLCALSRDHSLGTGPRPEPLRGSCGVQPTAARHPSPLCWATALRGQQRRVLTCAGIKDGQSPLATPAQRSVQLEPVAAATASIFSMKKVSARSLTCPRRRQSRQRTGSGQTIICTPALAEGALYVRSDQHLFKLAAHTDPGMHPDTAPLHAPTRGQE